MRKTCGSEVPGPPAVIEARRVPGRGASVLADTEAANAPASSTAPAARNVPGSLGPTPQGAIRSKRAVKAPIHGAGRPGEAHVSSLDKLREWP
jgi:hypothetical protein